MRSMTSSRVSRDAVSESPELGRREFLASGAAFAAGLAFTRGAKAGPETPAAGNAQEREPRNPPTLGPAPQIFVDLNRVERLENVKQVFHAAEKHPGNPVLRKEKPWEWLHYSWGTVIYDDEEEVFKTWYGGRGGPTGIDKPGHQKWKHVLCYATSTDGIHWERPELGLHETAGTKRNNVVVGEDHHQGMDHWESVLKDPADPDENRRYKGIGWSSFDWDGPLSGIYTMTSPDGLRWTHTPEPVFRFHPRPGTNDLGPVGDAQSLMIDTLRGRYVAFLRTLPHRAMSESTDFTRWTPPKTCLAARDGETSNTIYNHMGFVYGDQYLGLLTYFDRKPDNPLVTIRLLSSRDGDQWQYATDQPLVDVGEIGEPDRFMNMLTGGPPIRVGDRLYIYYRAVARRHGPYSGPDDTGEQFPGGFGLATLRADGFASLQASYDGGTVTTRPFRFSGQELLVNAKADFGRLAVEVLDENGAAVAGFGQDECETLAADGVSLAVRWKERENLAALKGKAVRLRFSLKNVRLYSYRIV